MKMKNQRWWDILAALFLLGALFSASVRLQMTNWTEQLGRVEFIVLLAAIIGFALGRSAFRGWISFLMGVGYTLFVIPWQLGLLIPPMDWGARLTIVYARMWYAVADFLSNKPVKDPILFLTTMMLLYWLASLLAAYRLVRYANPWLPLLSVGGMILVIEYTVEAFHYVSAPGGIYSLIYLLFCLLLLGRIYFLRSRKDWEQRGGTVELEVGYDLGRGVAVAAVIVALLAWNMPNVINFFDSKDPARERVSQGWQELRDRISKAANTLRSPNPTQIESYGSNMFLGTGGNQSEVVQFFVKPEGGRVDQRMYWAARTYSEYQNGQWQTSINGTRPIGPASVPVVYPTWILRHDVQFIFTTQIPLLRTLYNVNEPVDLSKAATAVVAQDNLGAVDLNAITIDPPLKAGDPYKLRASISSPTIAAMQDSTTDYPDWVKQRYLQMPSNFSPRIIELARQIAGEEATPYDKAEAITQYLRRTITYSISIPEPPRNRDPLEWFLFDERAGFCNYYASAEVMMLRSLGIPARMVVGYAEGTWDSASEQYVVRGKDSHAWPEVYFPQLGWIAFEPTVSQPQSVFPQGEKNNGANTNNTSGPNGAPTLDPLLQQPRPDKPENVANIDPSVLNGNAGPILPVWAIALIVLLLVVILLVFLEARRRRMEDLPLPSWIEKALDERGFRTPEWLRMWSRRSLRTPMENMFATVSFMLSVWGHKADPAQTPSEQIELLVNVVPALKDQALTLLEEYQRAMYSQYPANMPRARIAVSEIRSIGYRSWLMRLVGLET